MTRIAVRSFALGLAILAVLLTGTPAAGQSPTAGFETRRAPTPPRGPEIRLEPTMPPEQQGSRDQEFYPGFEVRSRHEPAFIEPFDRTVPTSQSGGIRIGLSAWTAPAVPYDIRQATGGLAFGLTFMWGVPNRQAKAPQPPPADR